MLSYKNLRYFIPVLLFLAVVLSACNNPAPTGPTPTPNPIFFPGCSVDNLVGQIDQANNKPGPDVIYLDPGCVYTLEQLDNSAVVDNVTINNGFPPILEDLTIQGNNALIEIVPAVGEENFGHFYITPSVELALYDLILQNGIRPIGGAIVNEGGIFFASFVVFENNEAKPEGQILSKGGAIYNQGGSVSVINGTRFEKNRAGGLLTPGSHQGGAIFSNNGTLEVYHTRFTENIAPGSGGAIYSSKDHSNLDGGLVTISDSIFSDNQAFQNGGSIALIDEIEGVFIVTSYFYDNWAGDSGGAIYSRGTDLGGQKNEFFQNHAVYGGAVYTVLSGEVSLSNYRSESTRFDGNYAEIGGAIFSENSELTVEEGDFHDNLANSCGAIRTGGSPVLDVLAGDLETAIRVPSTARITDSYFSYNQASLTSGGALCHVMGDLTIKDTRFIGNSAQLGGGGLIIHDQADLTGLSFSLNHAKVGGGLLVGYPILEYSEENWVNPHYMTFNTSISGSYFIGNRATYGGGGIYAHHRGSLAITKTFFRQNESPFIGGAIRLEEGDTYISNSTFGMNSATKGGGIYAHSNNGSNAVLAINHATFADNIASEISNGGDPTNKRWGGGGLNVGGTATVENSIFANNKSMDCQLDNGMNYSTSGTYSTDHTCAGLIEPNPRLVPFMTNGIFALLPISPLIDVLPNCSLADDQRGEPRPMGAACDPGAYEDDPNNPSSPDPPVPPPPMPDNPPDDSSENCPPFEDLDISVVLLNVPADTLVLPLYFRFPGAVPGQDETEFKAQLGNLESYKCDQQGFEDRLYCMFNLTPDLPGMALDLLLYKDDCEDPSYTLPKVTIPELRGSIPDPKLQCSEDLDEEACVATGGEMSGGDTPAKCICP